MPTPTTLKTSNGCPTKAVTRNPPTNTKHELREVLAEAIDKLPPGERWLFEALFIARLSLRFCARVLDIPKTTLARRRDALLAYLRADLENSPLIQERLRK